MSFKIFLQPTLILFFFVVCVGCKTGFSKRESASTSTGDYLPLSGGTLSGDLLIPGSNLNVGGHTTLNGLTANSGIFANSLTSNGPTTLQSTLDVAGDSDFAGGMSVAGNTHLHGLLTVDGAATFNDDVNLQDLNLSGDLTCVECIKPVNLAVGAVDSILTTASGGVIQWQPPKIQFGIKFEYVNASTIRLVPSGINGRASVLVTDGTNIASVTLTSVLNAVLSATGAGGLDTGAEAANTGYDVRLITDSDGLNPALLYTLAGNAPTMPAGFTLVSEVLWFVSNTQGGGSSDIARFVDMGEGVCQYLVSNGIRVLNDGEAGAVTPVNLTSAVSPLASMAGIYVNSTNLDILTSTNLRLYYDSGGTLLVGTINNLLSTVSLLIGSNKTLILDLPLHNGLTNSLFYSFSALPAIGDFGADIYVQKWKMPSRMSR